MPPSTNICDVMSAEVLCCFEDDDIDSVLEHMSEAQVRRLPVVDGDKHLVGVVSITDLAPEARKPGSPEGCR